MATTQRDKERLVRLHNKVDQLANVVGVLKQKGDRANAALLQCQQKYEFSQNEVAKLQELLAKVNGEKALLEERLKSTEESYEQMVQLKDQCVDENTKLSKKLKREAGRIEQLQKDLKLSKGTKDGTEKKCQQFERRIKELESKIESERVAHRQKFEKVISSHNNEMENLKKNVERLQVTVKKVTEESVNKSKQVAELQRNISRLNQFLSSNESKRQEHVTTVKTLETKLVQTRVDLEQTRRAHKEELSRDSRVSKMKKELGEALKKLTVLEEEYAAFKIHSDRQLAHERELNNKLRHLLD